MSYVVVKRTGIGPSSVFKKKEKLTILKVFEIEEDAVDWATLEQKKTSYDLFVVPDVFFKNTIKVKKE